MSKLLKTQFFPLLIAVPSVAVAQIAPGQSGISTEQTYSGRGAFDDLNAFGECFAAKQTKDATRLVSTPAGSVEEARVYKELIQQGTGAASATSTR